MPFPEIHTRCGEADFLLPSSWAPVVDDFDYGFAENGLTAYKMGQQLAGQSFIGHVGEEEYKKMVKFILHYIADMDDVPIKRWVRARRWARCRALMEATVGGVCSGTFIEFRNGMINVSPIGRNAS